MTSVVVYLFLYSVTLISLYFVLQPSAARQRDVKKITLHSVGIIDKSSPSVIYTLMIQQSREEVYLEKVAKF